MGAAALFTAQPRIAHTAKCFCDTSSQDPNGEYPQRQNGQNIICLVASVKPSGKGSTLAVVLPELATLMKQIHGFISALMSYSVVMSKIFPIHQPVRVKLLRFAITLVLMLCLWLPCTNVALAVTGNQQIASSGTASREPEYLLALSWQPSFCETKPNKQECQTQTSRRFDATHLVLHGLWPQPKANIYCGVDQRIIQIDQNNRWGNLPPINLSAATRRALAEKMPGFMSNLHLHEWYKHGTCYSHSPEEYFQESMALLDQVNNSSVRGLLERNIGRFLEANVIRSEFDRAFSQGAGARVQVQCERDIDQDRNNMVVELQLNLRGVIQPTTPIKGLLLAGRNAPLGCSRGEIDPAGVNQ